MNSAWIKTSFAKLSFHLSLVGYLSPAFCWPATTQSADHLIIWLNGHWIHERRISSFMWCAVLSGGDGTEKYYNSHNSTSYADILTFLLPPKLSSVEVFLIGAVAKAVATTATYPLQTVQSILRVSILSKVSKCLFYILQWKQSCAKSYYDFYSFVLYLYCIADKKSYIAYTKIFAVFCFLSSHSLANIDSRQSNPGWWTACEVWCTCWSTEFGRSTSQVIHIFLWFLSFSVVFIQRDMEVLHVRSLILFWHAIYLLVLFDLLHFLFLIWHSLTIFYFLI